MSNSSYLVTLGCETVRQFCSKNNLPFPEFFIAKNSSEWDVNSCGYYRTGRHAGRPDRICIAPFLCAPEVPKGARQWSYPGYVVDRTVYGVIAHELGHHVDCVRSEELGLPVGKYCGGWSEQLMEATGEEPITTYAPNHAEWFAEIFRLFVTNPDLLKQLRPKIYGELESVYKPIEPRGWEEVLFDAPEKVVKAAAEKIKKARKSREVKMKKSKLGRTVKLSGGNARAFMAAASVASDGVAALDKCAPDSPMYLAVKAELIRKGLMTEGVENNASN